MCVWGDRNSGQRGSMSRKRQDWNGGEMREPEPRKENLCDGRRPLCLARVLNEKKPPCGCVCFHMCVWVSAVVLGGRPPLGPTGAECRAGSIRPRQMTTRPPQWLQHRLHLGNGPAQQQSRSQPQSTTTHPRKQTQQDMHRFPPAKSKVWCKIIFLWDDFLISSRRWALLRAINQNLMTLITWACSSFLKSPVVAHTNISHSRTVLAYYYIDSQHYLSINPMFSITAILFHSYTSSTIHDQDTPFVVKVYQHRDQMRQLFLKLHSRQFFSFYDLKQEKISVVS